MTAARRIVWFGPPERPVEGTVHVRPAAEQTPEEAAQPDDLWQAACRVADECDRAVRKGKTDRIPRRLTEALARLETVVGECRARGMGR